MQIHVGMTLSLSVNMYNIVSCTLICVLHVRPALQGQVHSIGTAAANVADMHKSLNKSHRLHEARRKRPNNTSSRSNVPDANPQILQLPLMIVFCNSCGKSLLTAPHPINPNSNIICIKLSPDSNGCRRTIKMPPGRFCQQVLLHVTQTSMFTDAALST